MKERKSMPPEYYDEAHQQEADEAIESVQGSDERERPRFEDILADYPNIETKINWQELSLAQQQLCRETAWFCAQLTDFYRLGFDIAVKRRYAEQKSEQLNQKVIDHVKNRALDSLRFAIADEKSGNQMLEEFFDQEKIPSDQREFLSGGKKVLLVLNLPKPMAKFWWKRSKREGAEMADLGPKIIEWGLFYRMLMPYIWHSIDKAAGFIREETETPQTESGDYLNFHRVPALRHNPSKYYYVYMAGFK